MHPKNFALFILLIFLGISLFQISQKSKTPVFKCAPSDYGCYESYYSNLVKNEGIKETFNDLKKRYATDNFVKTDCHSLTHVIGRAASLMFKTPAEAFVYGDNFCSSGYYHGVMEGIAAKMGRAKLLANLNSVCSDIQGKSSYNLDYYNCIHGLGHGLMVITNDKLFESLNYCNTLIGDWEQKSCASGIFMENIIADGINHTTKFLKNDDLLYPCDQTPEKYKGTCYLMQSSYILRQENYDFVKTFDICSQADKYAVNCYQSLGRDTSGFTISDINSTKNICLLGKNPDQKLGCLIGAAEDFKYYFHGESQAKALCNSVDDQNLRSSCLNGLY